MEGGATESDGNKQPETRRRRSSALVAVVPASILAALTFAAGLAGSTTCEGGLCTLSDLFFAATPIVWIGAWIGFSLLISVFRRAVAAADRRGTHSSGAQ